MTKTMLLWDKEPPLYDSAIDQPLPTLQPFLVKDSKGAVIICPGGGYSIKAPHEGIPIAERFNSFGISAFVLEYRVQPYHFPAPLLDAQRAVRIVRAGAEGFGIDPNKIAMLGFSAGGHLCSTVATHFDDGNPESDDAIERVSCRLNAQILCYAVISLAAYTHSGSAKNIFGREDVKPIEYYDLSANHRVTHSTPPAFLWHTSDDEGVPVEQSLDYAAALRSYGIPFEMHIFPEGRHGLGLGDESNPIYPWSELAAKWLLRMGY